MTTTLLERLTFVPTCGDIGEPLRHIEIEPVPQTEPVHEPSPQVEPAEPAKEPQPA